MEQNGLLVYHAHCMSFYYHKNFWLYHSCKMFSSKHTGSCFSCTCNNMFLQMHMLMSFENGIVDIQWDYTGEKVWQNCLSLSLWLLTSVTGYAAIMILRRAINVGCTHHMSISRQLNMSDIDTNVLAWTPLPDMYWSQLGAHCCPRKLIAVIHGMSYIQTCH